MRVLGFAVSDSNGHYRHPKTNHDDGEWRNLASKFLPIAAWNLLRLRPTRCVEAATLPLAAAFGRVAEIRSVSELYTARSTSTTRVYLLPKMPCITSCQSHNLDLLLS